MRDEPIPSSSRMHHSPRPRWRATTARTSRRHPALPGTVRGRIRPAALRDGDRGGDGTLIVLEKTGRAWLLRDGQRDDTPFLDLSDVVSTASEQGLLGIAFPEASPRAAASTSTTPTAAAARSSPGSSTDEDGRARPGEGAGHPRVRAAVREPQRRHDRVRPRRDALHRRQATAARVEIPRATGSASTRTWASCCASTWSSPTACTVRASRTTSRTSTPSRQPVRGAMPRCARLRSGRTACATPGASRSTARPVTCGSATWAKTPGRRSTSSRRAAPAGRTTAGTSWRAPTPSHPRLELGDTSGYVMPVVEYDRGSGKSVTGGYVYRGTE